MEFETQKISDDAVQNLKHAAKIAAAMAPDPREWSYEGKFYEAEGMMPEHCACGHPIRNVYVVERLRDGAQIRIGSTCIDSTIPYLIGAGAEGLAEALRKALADQEAQRKEIQRRVAEAKASDEVSRLEADYEALRAYTKAVSEQLRSRHISQPEVIRYGIQLPKAASTPARTAASMRKRYADTWCKLAYLVANGYEPYLNFGIVDIDGNIPLSKDEKLVASISKQLGKDAEYYIGFLKSTLFNTEHYERRARKCQVALRFFLGLTGLAA